jgi:hypothetical protein
MNVGTVFGVLADNWLIAIGLFALALVLYWTFDERSDTSSAGETIEKVGERAEVVTNGFLGALGSLAVVGASIAIAIGSQLLELGVALNDLLGHIPFLAGYLVFGVVSMLGIEGRLPVSQMQLGWIFILILVVGLIAKYGGEAEEALDD